MYLKRSNESSPPCLMCVLRVVWNICKMTMFQGHNHNLWTKTAADNLLDWLLALEFRGYPPCWCNIRTWRAIYIIVFPLSWSPGMSLIKISRQRYRVAECGTLIILKSLIAIKKNTFVYTYINLCFFLYSIGELVHSTSSLLIYLPRSLKLSL